MSGRTLVRRASDAVPVVIAFVLNRARVAVLACSPLGHELKHITCAGSRVAHQELAITAILILADYGHTHALPFLARVVDRAERAVFAQGAVNGFTVQTGTVVRVARVHRARIAVVAIHRTADALPIVTAPVLRCAWNPVVTCLSHGVPGNHAPMPTALVDGAWVAVITLVIRRAGTGDDYSLASPSLHRQIRN